MKVRDGSIKQTVNVANSRCLKCSCYWPRPDPGFSRKGRDTDSAKVNKNGFAEPEQYMDAQQQRNAATASMPNTKPSAVNAVSL